MRCPTVLFSVKVVPLSPKNKMFFRPRQIADTLHPERLMQFYHPRQKRWNFINKWWGTQSPLSILRQTARSITGCVSHLVAGFNLNDPVINNLKSVRWLQQTAIFTLLATALLLLSIRFSLLDLFTLPPEPAKDFLPAVLCWKATRYLVEILELEHHWHWLSLLQILCQPFVDY